MLDCADGAGETILGGFSLQNVTVLHQLVAVGIHFGHLSVNIQLIDIYTSMKHTISLANKAAKVMSILFKDRKKKTFCNDGFGNLPVAVPVLFVRDVSPARLVSAAAACPCPLINLQWACSVLIEPRSALTCG